MRDLISRMDSIQGTVSEVTSTPAPRGKQQLNEFKTHQITDEGLLDALKLGGRLGGKAFDAAKDAYRGLAGKAAGKAADAETKAAGKAAGAETKAVTDKTKLPTPTSKSGDYSPKGTTVTPKQTKPDNKISMPNAVPTPGKYSAPLSGKPAATPKAGMLSSKAGKAAAATALVGAGALAGKAAYDALSGDKRPEAPTQAITPAAPGTATSDKPQSSGSSTNTKPGSKPEPRGDQTTTGKPGTDAAPTTGSADKTSNEPSAADIEAARVAAEKNAAEVAARSAAQQAQLAAQLQAAKDAAARTPAEPAVPANVVRSGSGEPVKTGSGGYLTTRTDDEIANTGPFGIKKPTAADREQGEKNWNAIKNFFGGNKEVTTPQAPNPNTTYSSTGYNAPGRVGIPDVEYVKEEREQNMKDNQALEALQRIAALSGQPISEAKMKELKGKKHSGSYGTEYQGDEDEDSDENKKKDKTKKSSAKDDSEKKKRGGQFKGDKTVSGEEKFKGADAAMAAMGVGTAKKSKELDKLPAKKHSLKEYFDDIAAEKHMIAENATLVQELDSAMTELKSVLGAKKVNESMMHLLEENDDNLEHIVKRFKHEVRNFLAGNDLDNDLYDALYDYYFDDMPYGVKKARDGDPYQWVSDRFYTDLVEDPIEDILHPDSFMQEPGLQEGLGSALKKAAVGATLGAALAANPAAAKDTAPTRSDLKKEMNAPFVNPPSTMQKSKPGQRIINRGPDEGPVAPAKK